MVNYMFAETVLKELIRNGYSRERGRRVWTISAHKLLYMTPQLAQGYLNIQKFPRYRANIIERELALLRTHVPRALEGVNEGFNLVDLGCGNGTKAGAIIQVLPRRPSLRYVPVDVSEPLLHLAATRVKDMKSKNVSGVYPIAQDFSEFNGLLRKIGNSRFKKNVFLLLGSAIASFDINELLFNLSRVLHQGDVLVIGNGIRTGKRFVELDKYRNPLFHKWLMQVMYALGFLDQDVVYDVRFAHDRLEFFFKVVREHVCVYNDSRARFRAGDEIVVAWQHKYYARELERFCKMYFNNVELVNDKANEYALLFCRK